jgi:hypothetical protein
MVAELHEKLIVTLFAQLMRSDDKAAEDRDGAASCAKIPALAIGGDGPS